MTKLVNFMFYIVYHNKKKWERNVNKAKVEKPWMKLSQQPINVTPECSSQY